MNGDGLLQLVRCNIITLPHRVYSNYVNNAHTLSTEIYIIYII